MKTEVLEPQYHAIVEVIANMKSNNGNGQQWAKDLEKILGVEEMVIYENNWVPELPPVIQTNGWLVDSQRATKNVFIMPTLLPQQKPDGIPRHVTRSNYGIRY